MKRVGLGRNREGPWASSDGAALHRPRLQRRSPSEHWGLGPQRVIGDIVQPTQRPTLLFRGGQAGGGPGHACVSRAAHKHEGCFQGRTGSWEAGHLRHRICGGQRVAQEGSPQSRRRAWPQLGVSRVLGRGGRLCALGQRGKPGFRGPDGSWVSCRRGLGLQGDQLLLVSIGMSRWGLGPGRRTHTSQGGWRRVGQARARRVGWGVALVVALNAKRGAPWRIRQPSFPPVHVQWLRGLLRVPGGPCRGTVLIARPVQATDVRPRRRFWGLLPMRDKQLCCLGGLLVQGRFVPAPAEPLFLAQKPGPLF